MLALSRQTGYKGHLQEISEVTICWARFGNGVANELPDSVAQAIYTAVALGACIWAGKRLVNPNHQAAIYPPSHPETLSVS